MSDEEVVAAEEEVIGGSTDQGPYTGGTEIPEEPYNPVAGMTPSEVTEKLAENQTAQVEDADE